MPNSGKSAQVAAHFGLPHCGAPTLRLERLQIPLAAGRIVLLTGPSGSGKSSVLDALTRQFPSAAIVSRIPFPSGVPIIDAVAPYGDFAEAARFLTGAGLGEPRLWLHSVEELSEGERFRARLAQAISTCGDRRGAIPILCDEFCSVLHRRAAKAVSFNLRKLVTRLRLCLVVATSHDDLETDLQPDTIVRMSGAGRFGVEHAANQPNRPVSFFENLVIEPGCKANYDEFAGMHYRATDELGFVDKVFVLRDRGNALTPGALPTRAMPYRDLRFASAALGPSPSLSQGEKGTVGIVVYAHSPLELRLRNEATEGRFCRDAHRLNREMRIVRRLVIHPDVRGCGLGHTLVRKTLPRVGTEFVECLSTLGAFNPVFEKAGMERIGRYERSAAQNGALIELNSMDIDCHGADFVEHVARNQRVRTLVMRTVREWYSGTTGGGKARVDRQSPQVLAQAFRGLVSCRPVYYLWQNEKRRSDESHGATKGKNC